MFTKDEIRVLRATLGLHETHRTAPMRNKLIPAYVQRDRDVFDALVKRGLMENVMTEKGETGKATKRGIELVLQQPWQ